MLIYYSWHHLKIFCICEPLFCGSESPHEDQNGTKQAVGVGLCLVLPWLLSSQMYIWNVAGGEPFGGVDVEYK